MTETKATVRLWTTDSGFLKLSLDQYGRLVFTLSDKGKDWLANDVSADANDVDTFYELMEYFRCNGQWEILTPEDIGALTGNPFLVSEDAERNDHGECIKCEHVWFYNAYAIRSPIDELREQGTVTFDKAHD
jgi:hypothetical protein